ncbi:MarR family winged helix-turn-helix transcriptional regulator [Streptantibioticus rubrisoli]|uniref:MarR family transcriptional regulator n=1 Tax=Streptantibioticus rubrisoli TaxID=1387313 RepID=A0ABT1PB33_9ACTN|nr:MarR family transcriptional regulator [Streptantibioticus rubrisoli]MCQ4042577.1 MarR family transcriptional regulator [Streptantibioticus rubrisoli]
MTNSAPAGMPKPPRLDDQLCFALHAASRAFDSLYRVLLRESGLTYPQYLVLLVLWEHGEVAVKSLGERLRLDSGTLSPLLKRLEAAGFVERRRSNEDERSVLVRTTEAGDALRGRACDVSMGVASGTRLNLAKAIALRDSLNELTEALDQAVKNT